MKATVEVPDDLYRRVKARAALEGTSVREVVTDLFTHWLGGTLHYTTPEPVSPPRTPPAWFGAARKYAKNVERHDMESLRESIGRGIASQLRESEHGG